MWDQIFSRFYKTVNSLLNIIFSCGCQCIFVNEQKCDRGTNNKVKTQQRYVSDEINFCYCACQNKYWTKIKSAGFNSDNFYKPSKANSIL